MIEGIHDGEKCNIHVIVTTSDYRQFHTSRNVKQSKELQGFSDEGEA